MAEVKILVSGYASEKTNRASSNTLLIQAQDVNIIADPGMDRKKLLKSLGKNNLSPSDINYVFQSHGHIDHTGLSAIFENATLVDDECLYTFHGGFNLHDGKIPETNVKIIKTPGHYPSHCSLIIDSEKGIVIFAGDVFWWYDEEEQKTDFDSLINHKDPWAKNEMELKKSRQEILKKADYIIPGHGDIFKSPK